MTRRRPKAALTLSPHERETLEDWARRAGTPQALAGRARIVLACAEGAADVAVAQRLGVNPDTVGKWRRRFVEARLAGLRDAPRSGAPPRIPPGTIEWLLTLTLFSTPRAAPRWTTRSMAEASGLSQSVVSRVWRGFRLRPASTRPAQRRADARSLARFEDLAALYLDPRRRATVRVHRVESRGGLRDWLAARDAELPEEARAELILCACDSGDEAEARAWQRAHPRFGLHLAPRGPLWVEMVERWFQPGSGSGPRRGIPRILEHVSAETESRRGFEGDSVPYAWTPRGQEILESAARSIP
jgi:transposase